MYYCYPREKRHTTSSARPVRRSAPDACPNGNVDAAATRTSGKSTARSTWDVIKDRFALGANVYYSPSWLNSGAYGLFASGTAKIG